MHIISLTVVSRPPGSFSFHGWQYEPIYDSSSSVHYLQHITLHECQGAHAELEEMAREQGRQCLGARSIPLACNAIVASSAFFASVYFI